MWAWEDPGTPSAQVPGPPGRARALSQRQRPLETYLQLSERRVSCSPAQLHNCRCTSADLCIEGSDVKRDAGLLQQQVLLADWNPGERSHTYLKETSSENMNPLASECRLGVKMDKTFLE